MGQHASVSGVPSCHGHPRGKRRRTREREDGIASVLHGDKRKHLGHEHKLECRSIALHLVWRHVQRRPRHPPPACRQLAHWLDPDRAWRPRVAPTTVPFHNSLVPPEDWYRNLYTNSLSGSIPSELGSLASLQYLCPFTAASCTEPCCRQLDSNSLLGSIPAQLSSLTAVSTLC